MWISHGFLCEMLNELYIYDEELRERFAQVEVDIGESGLTKVFLDVTNRCNLACEHCFTAALPASSVGELDTGQLKGLISDLAAMEVRRIAFGGGEPLMRPDFEELVAHCTDVGIRTHLGTAGMLLTPRRLAALVEAGLESVQVSIDSLRPEVHDRLRGQPGLLDKALEAADRVLEADLGLIVATTVMSINLEELGEIMAGLQDRGVPVHRLIRMIPVGRGESPTRELAPEPRALFETMLEIRRRFGRHLHGTPWSVFGFLVPDADPGQRLAHHPLPNGCEAGKVSCDILPDGKVVPCNYFGTADAPFVAGSVTEEPFHEIWQRSPLLQWFRSMDGGTMDGTCTGCQLSSNCGKGCRAVAYLATGSLTEHDPTCSGMKQLRGMEVEA